MFPTSTPERAWHPQLKTVLPQFTFYVLLLYKNEMFPLNFQLPHQSFHQWSTTCLFLRSMYSMLCQSPSLHWEMLLKVNIQPELLHGHWCWRGGDHTAYLWSISVSRHRSRQGVKVSSADTGADRGWRCLQAPGSRMKMLMWLSVTSLLLSSLTMELHCK